MNKKYLSIFGVTLVGVVVLVLVFLVKPGKASYDTIFPLPTAVQSFTKMGDEAINFQTPLNIKDSEQFYRTNLIKMGLVERTINTAVTDTTFSMVFDGYKNGKAVVVQGVDISGKTNVNIRFEQL